MSDRNHGGTIRRSAVGSARVARVLTLATAVAMSGCAAKPALSAHSDRLQVVTTTGLLRDLVENVGGDQVDVASLVPEGADPHSYEPTLRDARNVVYADVAFSNYALLEERNVIKTLDANVQEGTANVSLAEESIKYAAEIIPLIENVNLDTIWLGLRVQGDGSRQFGATRTSEVELSATSMTGPGDVSAYLTGSFGDTDLYLDSSDGFDAANGYRDDTMTLPVDAHTHLSWAFSEPGTYTLTLAARIRVDEVSKPVELDEQTFTFAVGVDPTKAGVDDPIVLDEGHADVTADLDARRLGVLHDPEGGGEHSQRTHPADRVVIDVPPKALDEIPVGEQFSFLGKAGDDIYQLPQAVLGKHIHGEIDPHLWQNVRNSMAYVQLIRDTLIAADPDGASEYSANANDYLTELERLDQEVRRTIADVPEHDRNLVTTHDAFGYLADAYALEIAGFVVPHPAVEPSLADRRKLTETIRTLGVPAVFLEPNLVSRASMLAEVASDAGVDVCRIYGDTFDEEVTTYMQMMRFNARSVHRCLTS